MGPETNSLHVRRLRPRPPQCRAIEHSHRGAGSGRGKQGSAIRRKGSEPAVHQGRGLCLLPRCRRRRDGPPARGPLLRYRRAIAADDVAVFCDIKKKHCSHSLTADLSVADTAGAAALFGADGVVLTGAADRDGDRPGRGGGGGGGAERQAPGDGGVGSDRRERGEVCPGHARAHRRVVLQERRRLEKRTGRAKNEGHEGGSGKTLNGLSDLSSCIRTGVTAAKVWKFVVATSSLINCQIVVQVGVGRRLDKRTRRRKNEERGSA